MVHLFSFVASCLYFMLDSYFDITLILIFLINKMYKNIEHENEHLD